MVDLDTLTHAERILAELARSPGLTDRELVERTGIRPHQAVNQTCRRLEAQGRLRRSKGPGGPILNMLVEPHVDWDGGQALGDSLSVPLVVGQVPDAQREMSTPTAAVRPPTRSAVVVLPCSGRKAAGGWHGSLPPGLSVFDVLSKDLAARLRDARHRVAQRAQLDERMLLPAAERYVGMLYRHASLTRSVDGPPTVIASGGYGLVLPTELIGTYDRRFNVADWPAGLLEACLIDLTRRSDARAVVGFVARTTSYADLMRRTPWRSQGIDASIASPDMGARRGAQVLVPRAAGQAFAALRADQLTASWRSTDGIALRWEQL